MGNVILEVKDLKVSFYKRRREGQAVRDVNFTLEEGQTLGIIGESGSGKSVSGMSVMGLVPSIGGKIRSGEIIYEGTDLLKLSPKEMRKIQGNKIAMIFQEPMTSLNPVFTVGYQLCEPLRFHLHMTKAEAEKRAVELLRMVGLSSPEKRVLQYPHQLSGGQRQRVAIARALVVDPEFIIADEPVSMFDVSLRAGVLNLLQKMNREKGIGVLLITHDLATARFLCNRIVVMYLGKFVEITDPTSLVDDAVHPYTQLLISSAPDLFADTSNRIKVEGEAASAVAPPKGCRFSPRCPYAKEICRELEPELVEYEPRHFVACHKAAKDF